MIPIKVYEFFRIGLIHPCTNPILVQKFRIDDMIRSEFLIISLNPFLVELISCPLILISSL